MAATQESKDRIAEMLKNPERLRDIVQAGINDALLKHKQAGNPVCESRDGKIVWIQPEDIVIGNIN